MTLDTQEDWGLLKSKFNKKFGLANTDKEQWLYFYAQVKALRQGNKQIPEYIQEGETLVAFTLNKDMAFSVVQAFVNGLNNHEHKQMLDLVLLDDLYTFQEVKTAVRKLHFCSPGITPAFAYPAAAASVQPDPITAMMQAFQNVCNKMMSQAPHTHATSPLRYPGRTLYLHQPLKEVICYNCLEPGHYKNGCTLALVSYE